MTALISTTALKDLLDANPDSVRVVDATYANNAYDIWRSARIGNAAFFDIDAVADPSNPLPHTLPTADDFAAAVSAMGLGNSHTVVVYDQGGMAMAASRAWWMFRVFGHDNVLVLDGGLPAWLAAGYALNDTPPANPAPITSFTARLRPDLVRGKDDILASLKDGSLLVIDARSAGRFAGLDPEPRPGLRSGHIPRSLNIPFMTLIDPRTGRLKLAPDLERLLAPAMARGIDSIACSCGSGVTACVVALAFYEINKKGVAVYDGSWSEWGLSTAGTPVEKIN